MGLTKRTYALSDLLELNLENAPSLDLPHIEVEKFLVPKDHGKYMLFLANVKKSVRPDKCPYCREKTNIILSGRTQPRVIHDLIRNNCRVDIAVQPVRCQCKKCDRRFTISIPGIDDTHSMTTRLLNELRTECFLQPHTVLAEKSGISVESVRLIMDMEIQKYDEERRLHPLLAPRVLGIDEKHINRTMRGTLVDVDNGLLLDMLENNDPLTMKEAIMRLTDWDSRIKVVTTDMSNAYLHWLPQLLPNATIVVDKFHMIQDIQRRIISTRKQLYNYRKKLIYALEDGEEKARQISVLRILSKNPRLFNYSMESIVRDTASGKAQQLVTVMEEFPEFRLLRKLYSLIENMYLQESYQEAEAVWDEWITLLPPAQEKAYKEWCDLYSVVPPLFDDFRSFSKRGFQRFKPYILNYFKPGCRKTNSTTEGLNNLIGTVNAAGNGYSFKYLRAKCLYASLVHERILYGIDIKTIEKWKPT